MALRSGALAQHAQVNLFYHQQYQEGRMGEGRNSGDLSRFTEGTQRLASTSGISGEWKQKLSLGA